MDPGGAPEAEEFERLDRLLGQLGRVLEAPGDDGDAPAEMSWQRLDLLYASMGSDALGALLRRQGMNGTSTAEALEVLESRRRLMP